MQKDMNIDNLPPAIVHEEHKAGRQDRSDSLASVSSVEAIFDTSDIDQEVAQAILDFEVSDSPNASLRASRKIENVKERTLFL